MLKPRIYLDYAATTPVRSEVVEAMLPFFTENGFNAASVHAEGRAAREALDDARSAVARVLNAKPKEIVFTGSGSEADNLAIAGTARALRSRGRHLISTRIEHHAVLHTLDALRDDGWEVTLLDVDDRGLVVPQTLQAALRTDTTLVSIAYANNELGTIQPIAELADLAHASGALFHTDAVQAPLFLPLDVGQLGVDLLSIASHKFYGPKGVGALYVRDGVPVEPLIHGGPQEHAKRAGTENVAGIVGFSRALELAVADSPHNCARIRALRDDFEAQVLACVPGVRVNGARAPRLPNISNLSFKDTEAEQLLLRLDIEGVAVSAGSACASGAIERSHVIAALGLPEQWASGVVRFSFGRTTTSDEVDRVVSLLRRIVPELRGG